MFDVDKIREDFPILKREVCGHRLVYLDNSATSQMPSSVIDRIVEHYSTYNANVHRGIHTLSNESTKHMEDARISVANFIGAKEPSEVIFTSGATDSLNMAAYMLEQTVSPGDEIIVTVMEHHSNFVPWQMLAERKNAIFKVCPIDENGDLDLDTLKKLITDKTKIVACAHVSNVLGTVNPIKKIVQLAHEAGAAAVIDGAQAMLHEIMNVDDLGCDMYAFSGHKMMAPGGIGVLYIRSDIQKKLMPVRFGGGMVDKVNIDNTTFESAPFGYEAGTPNYSGAWVMEAAADYLENIGRKEALLHEQQLIEMLTDGLDKVSGIHVLGKPAKRSGAVSFTMEGAHPYDIAVLLDKLGIAVRSGTHCAQPLMSHYGVEYTVRVSPAFYNTEEEIEYFLEKIKFIKDILVM